MADNGTGATGLSDKKKCHLAKPTNFNGKDFKPWW
jgi:hypothetical protein